MPDDNPEIQPQETVTPAPDAPADVPATDVAPDSSPVVPAPAADASAQPDAADSPAQPEASAPAPQVSENNSADAPAPQASTTTTPPPAESETAAPPPEPAPPASSTSRTITTPASFITDLLRKAQAKIQSNKRKKLEKIVEFARTKDEIENKDVQKLLKVSDKTAERYLSQLVKEGSLVRTGPKTGSRYHAAP
ncbi:MAG: hypothetical protein KGI60_00850 [Patescibacteria group bacterium]|nr:hypothetical protein [Patescibacteria group bacterium]